jgi:histidine triad (HIT) family protein
VPPDAPAGCIFCRIVEGNMPATIVNRTEGFVAIEDINPQAEVHLLVLPERHIDTFRDIAQFPADEAKRMLVFVAETAAAAGLDEYRLMLFCGAGQTVFHLHWHILGGRMQGLFFCMSLIADLEEELTEARLARDAVRRDALALTLSSLRSAEKELQRSLTDDEEP